MDNFEWSFGYSKRFGMVWTTSPLRAHPKASAAFYTDVIRRNGVDA